MGCGEKLHRILELRRIQINALICTKLPSMGSPTKDYGLWGWWRHSRLFTYLLLILKTKHIYMYSLEELSDFLLDKMDEWKNVQIVYCYNLLLVIPTLLLETYPRHCSKVCLWEGMTVLGWQKIHSLLFYLPTYLFFISMFYLPENIHIYRYTHVFIHIDLESIWYQLMLN